MFSRFSTHFFSLCTFRVLKQEWSTYVVNEQFCKHLIYIILVYLPYSTKKVDEKRCWSKKIHCQKLALSTENFFLQSIAFSCHSCKKLPSWRITSNQTFKYIQTIVHIKRTNDVLYPTVNKAVHKFRACWKKQHFNSYNLLLFFQVNEMRFAFTSSLISRDNSPFIIKFHISVTLPRTTNKLLWCFTVWSHKNLEMWSLLWRYILHTLKCKHCF